MMYQKLLLLAALAGLMPAQTPTSGASTYLGVWVLQIDEARAQELRLPVTSGVQVTLVSPGSPAASAGLKVGDVITEFNGERIRNNDHFSALVRDTRAGTNVELQVYRNAAPLSITARVGAVMAVKVPAPVISRTPMPMPDVPRSVTTWRNTSMGMDTEAIDGQLAGYFGVAQGVLVRSVVRDSAAARAGIKAGDVIVAVTGGKVTTPTEVTLRLRGAQSGSAPLQIVRERKEISVTLTLDPAR